MKILCAQTNPTVADLAGNAAQILKIYRRGVKEDADIVIFPELALCGYSPEDLLLSSFFMQEVVKTAEELAAHTTPQTALVIGTPWPGKRPPNVPDYIPFSGHSANAALFCVGGKIAHIIQKTDLPNFGVFDEKRYFKPALERFIVPFKGVKLGIPVCRDTWLPDTCAELHALGAQALLSVNASPYELNKHQQRIDFIANRVAETGLPLLYLNLIGAQDGVVFDGRSFTLNPGESVSNLQPAFEESVFSLSLEAGEEGYRFAKGSSLAESPFRAEGDIFAALTCGLGDYMHKNGFKEALLGLSGGVDSALTAAVAAQAIGAENVTGVIMPSPHTSKDSLEDAAKLAKHLGIKTLTVPIDPAMAAFDDLFAEATGAPPAGLTAENLQPRIRGTLLMALSNARPGSLLLATGNKSEFAVGYTTLYGDMCGGYAVLKDVYKTDVYTICRWLNEEKPTIPERILTKAPSAELRPDQKDIDSLPPYEELDDILRMAIEKRAGLEEIVFTGHERTQVEGVLKMLRTSEFKRRQAPPGTKVTPLAFERDWRYPITSKPSF